MNQITMNEHAVRCRSLYPPTQESPPVVIHLTHFRSNYLSELWMLSHYLPINSAIKGFFHLPYDSHIPFHFGKLIFIYMNVIFLGHSPRLSVVTHDYLPQINSNLIDMIHEGK